MPCQAGNAGSSDHRCFKLRGDDGAVYLVRHDEAADRWELTMFQREG
jgi:hypothetical protein